MYGWAVNIVSPSMSQCHTFGILTQSEVGLVLNNLFAISAIADEQFSSYVEAVSRSWRGDELTNLCELNLTTCRVEINHMTRVKRMNFNGLP